MAVLQRAGGKKEEGGFIALEKYRDYRYPPEHDWQYSHNTRFWHILAAKLAFIIIMEHVVFAVKFFVAWMISDVPTDVKARIKRERYLIQEYLHHYEVEKLRVQLSQHSGHSSTEPATAPTVTVETHNIYSECL
ncbi:hypothetical protein SKAU_G00315620 [Synaphobranchus kaupii]|uniref:Anoctamin n=1 Tax=Synaphobranchus kaupii TaxID=118154 RepID=A0A9Q1ILH8_SYNKA|nr:hypothetical protein SKAU_G00315620 [Synaphobranchus kaupii]